MRHRPFAPAIALAILLPVTALAGTGKVRDVGGGKRVLDFCVSVRFDATASELANVERAFTDASAIVADATDGRFEFGRISIVNGSQGGREAEAFVYAPEGRAYGTGGLYGTPGEHVTLYYPSNFVADPVPEGDAYTIAHEFMHHVWGVRDEYSGPHGPAECEPPPGSPTASFCLLDNYFVRGGNDGFGTGTYTLNELCVEANHDPDLDTFEELQWGMSCWERLASHPTRPVVAPAGLPDDLPPTATLPLFRYPTAERRFVLCIDRSSDESADGDLRLGYEQQAASVFIDLLPDGDELAVVSFAGHASVDFAMTAVDSAAREAAKAAVAALEAEGTTSIAAGLAASRDILTAQVGVPCAQTIILMTDGFGNTGVDELSLVPSLIDAEISVVTIAVGTSVSVANLQSIATDTAGRFLVLPGLGEFAPLVAELSADVLGGAANSEVGSSVAEGDTIDVQVIVDELMEDVTFVLAWPDFADNLDLFLRTPSGRIITFADALSDPNIVFVDENGSEIFILQGAAVEDGIWSALVAGREVIDDGSFCLLTIHTRESAIMIGAPERPTYDLTEAITLTATPRLRGNAVAGATVGGSFTRPDGTGGGLVLEDDGLDPDIVAGDGVYTTRFDDFQGIAGAYAFRLEVENVNGTTFGGEGHYASVGAPIFSEPAPPFVRIATTSAVVSPTNSAPLVSCPGIVGVDCDPDGEGTPAVIEVGVFDANGDALTVEWFVDGILVQSDEIPGGAPPTQAVVQLPWSFGDGVHTVHTTVHDGEDSDACTSTVTVADGTAPALVATPSHVVLWPPNHRLVDITVEIFLEDACDAEPAFELTSVRSDEPGEEEDIVGTEFGTPDTEFQLRAERLGEGDGREYTIIYTARDDAGNSTEHVSVVLVPHNFLVSELFGNEESFIADGTDLQPDADTYLLVVPAESEANMDPASVRVGNQDGTTRLIAHRVENVVGDERADVILEFDAARTRALRDATADPIGLSFLTTASAFYWTEDIFALGPPIAFGPATGGPETGTEIALLRPLPNPFRGSCAIAYAVPAAGAPVRIEIYDVQGRRIRTLADGREAGGVRQIAWDGRNGESRPAPAGVYFFRVAIGQDVRALRVTLLR